MLSKLGTSIKNKIKERDMFHHSPSLSTTSTVPGGIQSMILGAFFWWLWFFHLDIMFSNEDPQIFATETTTDFA